MACGADSVARLTAEGVGVGQGGKTVAEPAAIGGAPGLACCIAASRVAISPGEGVGSSLNGEANTGEVKVVEVVPSLPTSATAHGVGDGVADVGNGVTAGAQAVAPNKQTQTTKAVASLKCIMSLTGLLLELLPIMSRLR